VKKDFKLLTLLLTLLLAKNAHAYLDPGTGSYMIQIILGTVAAGFFAIKHYWRRIIALIQRNKIDENEE